MWKRFGLRDEGVTHPLCLGFIGENNKKGEGGKEREKQHSGWSDQKSTRVETKKEIGLFYDDMLFFN